MTFNLPKNLFDARGFEALRASGLSEMNWKSMLRIFLILAGKIAIGLFIGLFIAYVFILFSVYSAMSSIVSDFGSEANWYDSPIIAGILFITVADFVTGYIFAGLVLKKNKIIAIGLIAA